MIRTARAARRMRLVISEPYVGKRSTVLVVARSRDAIAPSRDDDQMQSGYELIDAGDGRRLERFGDVVVDRPAASAGESRRDAAAWASADLIFDRLDGWRIARAEAPAAWTVGFGALTLELRRAEAGQVGVFPEQQANWSWLAGRLTEPVTEPVLNLFAYTGASTLALAAAGAGVAHVDASRTAVTWARRNASLSGLSDRPVRWLVDDADAFVARELRRGRRYAAVVLDPPSYGHGPGGRTWRLEQHLPSLLQNCVALARGSPAFVLLTAHTVGFDGTRLAEQLGVALRVAPRDVESGELGLVARSGARLPLGAFARWPRGRAAHPR
jgi:23S rRNA (cytosine1962-C5)-methyltransferase